ncbi:hypothetical protein CEXT_735941 [Caerostris extrusa]|uniref:Uncharacterized protein n=1 Tax=Caerostris extrusa TaxID=172846 RepID=A0AAV4PPT0_CAEEX|nr:hypothetical protein CEXT_735941 [Caerostris extrusa]
MSARHDRNLMVNPNNSHKKSTIGVNLTPRRPIRGRWSTTTDINLLNGISSNNRAPPSKQTAERDLRRDRVTAKCATQSKDPQLYNLYTLVKKFVEPLLTLRNSLMDAC